MPMYPWTRMVRKLDQTACIVMFTLTVLCGTVAATTPAATTAMETTTTGTVPPASTTDLPTATDAPTTAAATPTVMSTVDRTTATVMVTTPKAVTAPPGATMVTDPASTTDDTYDSTTDDDEDTTSTGTSAMGTTADDDDDSNSTMANSTTSGVTNSPAMTCFTCVTNDTGSSCYGEQSAGPQPNTTCKAGEQCWTTRIGNEATFFNLTRSCNSDPCSSMHGTADSKYCQEVTGLNNCTQCCAESMCNTHVNDGVSDGGNDVLGCLTTLVLSAVVTLMIIL